MATERRREVLRKSSRKYRQKNLEACLQRVRNLKKRYIQEGRCTSCSAPLVQGENRTCVNCGNTIKGEMKYAADSLRLAKVF